SGGLSDADIEKMVKDAEEHAAEDKKRREGVEARNQAESLIHSTEKSLTEYGDKVSAEEKEQIETAISDLKAALDGTDTGEVTAKMQKLA
ncbi:MAG: Hsp70 family protein, partial [Bartonella sp.]|nr:Hsp70 family protein [Bartonella sp.]